MSTKPRSDLADFAELQALVNKYAYHVRHGEGPKLADLYAEDGRFVVFKGGAEPAVDVAGRDNLRSLHKDMRAGGAVPIVSNLLVEVAGDRANGTCVMYSPRSGRETNAGPAFWGEYLDTFVRVGGQWRFKERRFTYYS